MKREELIRGLVEELNEFGITELLEFRDDEERELELLGYPKEIRDHVSMIIDVVIQVKQERMGKADDVSIK
ncbi:hypothetical protein LK537_25535 [Lachnoclostridium pacaense]|uniref:hypothetical protein n=1 Tax=Enterocloster hominis (ex Hitch et al. 2024) TaxID=1917870 RepID=UPI001D11CAE2|nr:hypothetical protein [Lachnoclostridium pacaense]MCC2820675.1 hypothetical protein [Lachnoclostridium pacaense]